MEAPWSSLKDMMASVTPDSFHGPPLTEEESETIRYTLTDPRPAERRKHRVKFVDFSQFGEECRAVSSP